MTNAIELKKEAPMKFDVEALISQAIDKQIPVETMEKLLSMRRELKAEWAKEQFTKAMAAFQAECPTIQKTKNVQDYNGKSLYHYAPIESIVEQVKDAMQTHGFSYSTGMEFIENGTMKVKVSIKVTHKDGHSEVTDMTVPLGEKTKVMSGSQQVAAAQTFAKRYAFCNAFGILTGDEDTDARPTEPQPVQKAVTPVTPVATQPGELISPKQITMLFSLLGKKGYTSDQIKKKYKIESIKDLPKVTASNIIDALLKRPNVDRENMPSMPMTEYDDAVIESTEHVNPEEVEEGLKAQE